jgi:hypothetical protein
MSKRRGGGSGSAGGGGTGKRKPQYKKPAAKPTKKKPASAAAASADADDGEGEEVDLEADLETVDQRAFQPTPQQWQELVLRDRAHYFIDPSTIPLSRLVLLGSAPRDIPQTEAASTTSQQTAASL